jgi:hypothetical protein
MSARPHRRRALLVCALFLAAEIFAYAPQLHAHAARALRPDAAAGATRQAAAGANGQARGAAPGAPGAAAMRTGSGARHPAEECPACRIASLVMVAQGRPPLSLPLPRPAAAAVTPAQRPCSRSLDIACGRAPPRA